MFQKHKIYMVVLNIFFLFALPFLYLYIFYLQDFYTIYLYLFDPTQNYDQLIGVKTVLSH